MDLAAELQEMYEAGLLTRGELINKLIDLAADVDPASYIPTLPAQFSSVISELVQYPPATTDDVFILGSFTYTGLDTEAAVKRQRERAFGAIQRLHQYFHAGPRFRA